MTTRVLCAIATFVLATLGIGAATARAELAIDLFGGVSWTKSTDVAVDGIDNTNVSVRGVFADVDLNPASPSGYGSATGSSPRRSWGSASTTTASGQVHLPSFELPSAGFSPQLTLRWPLMTSNDLPKGRFQPYVGVGPAWAVTIDTDKAALAEYRYSFFPDFELRDKSGLHFTTDLDTHNLVGGISIRF